MVRALENELIHIMVRCLAEGAAVAPTAGSRRHDTIVARFEKFLEVNPDRPLFLTEICAAIGVAERTLRASCEEHLGMGPIRYLTPAPNAPRAARAPAFGSVRGNRHADCHRPRLLGARALFGGLPRAVRRVAVMYVAASRGAAGSPSQSPVTRCHKLRQLVRNNEPFRNNRAVRFTNPFAVTAVINLRCPAISQRREIPKRHPGNAQRKRLQPYTPPDHSGSSSAWTGTETTLGIPHAVEICISWDIHAILLGEHVADDRRDAAVTIDHRRSRGAVSDDQAVLAFITFPEAPCRRASRRLRIERTALRRDESGRPDRRAS